MWTDYAAICCTGLSEQTRCMRHAHKTAHQLPASLQIHGCPCIRFRVRSESDFSPSALGKPLGVPHSHPPSIHRQLPSIQFSSTDGHRHPFSNNKVGVTLINKTASTFPGPNVAAKPTTPEARHSVMLLRPPCTQPVILPQLSCPFASLSTW